MKRLIILISIFTTLTLFIACKKKYAISGKVFEPINSQPAVGVKLTLMQCLDSRSFCTARVIGSSTTDSNGEYHISGKFRPKGRFYLSFENKGIGYHIDVKDINDKNVNIFLYN